MRLAERFSLLAPLSVRAFRFQWPADLLTACAFEMEIIILGWWVLAETGSVLLLTVYGALHFFGTVSAPMLGVIGDRIGARRLLTIMRSFYTLFALILMTMAVTGSMSLVPVLVIAALMATVRASDISVRAALVAEMLPPSMLTSGLGLSRTTGDGAKVIGALAGASVFAFFGIGRAYMVVVAFYFAGLLLTLGSAIVDRGRTSGDRPHRADRRSPWSELKEGLAYVWRTPHLNAGMWLAVLVNFTGFPLSNGLMPYVAREIYKLDKQGLGLLVASFAAGAFLGSLTVSALSVRLQLARMMVIAAVLWHAILFMFAQMTTAAGGITMMLCAGFMQSLSMVTLAAMLLRTSEINLRGRVMGVRMLATYSLPLGLLLLGALIEIIGFRPTASLSAVTGIVMSILIAVWWRQAIWLPDAPANQR
jgi:predicted MFS family arabinose efflux permease